MDLNLRPQLINSKPQEGPELKKLLALFRGQGWSNPDWFSFVIRHLLIGWN